MLYHEYVFSTALILVLSDRLLPAAHLWVVVVALLLVAIRREESC